jgi:integrase
MARKGREDRGLFPYHLKDGTLLYGVRLYRHGEPYKWQGFKRKKEARDWYEDRRKDIREGRPFPNREAHGNTVDQVIAVYLAQNTHKKNYAGEAIYAAFWRSQLGRFPLALITPAHVDQGRTVLLTDGNGRGVLRHATVNRYVAWLHHLFQLEMDKGTITRNPCRRLKFKEPKAPEVEFTEAEELALARELGPDADYPSLAILTGLRQGEQFGLRWEDLDMARGYGRLHDPKGGEPQVFMINPAAAEILDRLKARAGQSPWVFPDPRDPSRPRNGKIWYKDVFKPAAKRAEIMISRKDGKTYHTLRHTFASRLQQKGVPVKDIKDLGRWKSWKAMDRYLKRDTARLRSAIDQLTAPKPPLDRPPIPPEAPNQLKIGPEG